MTAIRSARSRLVVVGAALAVLVTLFPAVGSAAVVEACPTNLPSTGYSDLGGLSAETIDAIECITHYGIAQGVTSTRFDPAGDVTRWQMALFLVRLADDLGISVPAATTTGFDDLAGYPLETRRAIDQLAQLGITGGVAPRQFDPAGDVTRWQMALFLTRLHAKAGLALPDGRSQGFADIAAYPAATQKAINQLSQLGIAKGTTSTAYSPAADVARWQMSLFLSRQLQAGGAAPYRISIDADRSTAATSEKVNVTVTVLTPTGAPAVGRLVDVFVGSTDSQGRCVLDADVMIGSSDAGTGTNCRIDKNDPKTDSTGKVRLVLSHNSVIETDRVFAWIGATDQVFDADVVALVATIDIVWTAQAAAIVVPAKVVPFGTTTTVQGWLVDGSGKAVAVPGQKIVVTVSRGGSQIIAHSLQTGIDGRFTFSYTGPSDPNPSAPDPAVVDTVKAFWDKDGDGKDDGAAEFDVTSTVTWDDAEPRVDRAVLGQSSVSTLAGQSVSVTATVTDKFGLPIGGAEVSFIVVGANPGGDSKLTNSSGVATFTFTATNAGVNTVDATVDVDDDGTDDLEQSDVADLTHYTVATAGNLAGSRTFDIVAVNTSANTVDVIGGGSHLRLSWDSTGDTFTVDGSAVSMATFETALSGLTLPAVGNVVDLKTNPYAATASAASTFILTTK